MPWERHARTLLAASLLIAILALGGCNLIDTPLEPAAVKYYNFMQGLAPGKSYSSFTSPAFRKGLPKASVAKLDETMGRSSKKNPRAVEVKAAQIKTVTSANFGLSAASEQASFAAQSLGETKWVKDGGKWYLFMNSEAEVKKYGQFPQLTIPREQPKGEIGDPDVPQ